MSIAWIREVATKHLHANIQAFGLRGMGSITAIAAAAAAVAVPAVAVALAVAGAEAWRVLEAPGSGFCKMNTLEAPLSCIWFFKPRFISA